MTITEIINTIETGEYSAEMMMQHLLIQLNKCYNGNNSCSYKSLEDVEREFLEII